MDKKLEALRKEYKNIPIPDELDFIVKKAPQATIEFLSHGKVDTYNDIDLNNALDELPTQYKTVIILRFFEDLKLEEIAEIMDENINTVKIRLYRGLKLLRIIITEEELI